MLNEVCMESIVCSIDCHDGQGNITDVQPREDGTMERDGFGPESKVWMRVD